MSPRTQISPTGSHWILPSTAAFCKFAHFYLDARKAEDYKVGTLPKAQSSAPSIPPSPCGKRSQTNNGEKGRCLCPRHILTPVSIFRSCLVLSTRSQQ